MPRRPGEFQRTRGAALATAAFLANDRRRRAIRLYESLGTREDVHHFDIAVEE